MYSGNNIKESLLAFKGQNYDELKNRHDENNLFEDPYFPATNSSIYFKKKVPDGVKWLRPREAISNPEFVVNGFERFDIDQGAVGNCWFISAVVSVMDNKPLFSKIVPLNQSFNENYSGIFHFRFWIFGEWVDVVVDDRLPYLKGKLLFCYNRDEPNEYWAPLLEKAYAKLYGSYESLQGGQTYDALIDMSGGLQEEILLKSIKSSERPTLWYIIKTAFKKGSLMGCTLQADPKIKELIKSNGLIKGHAYSVTGILDEENLKLIRIRNPWGNGYEWKGAWSDGSKEWNEVGPDLKRKISFVQKGDGEFWMSFEDFVDNWDLLQICHLSAESFSQEILENNYSPWAMSSFQSEWKTGKSAGGSGMKDQAKFWTNPQFLIEIGENGGKKTDVILSLLQKDARLKRSIVLDKVKQLFIQLRIFRVKDSVNIYDTLGRGSKLYANDLVKIGSSGPYLNKREVTQRFSLQQGYYVIIPSIINPDVESEFLLRIFTESPIDYSNQLIKPKDSLTKVDSAFITDTTNIRIKQFIDPFVTVIIKGRRARKEEKPTIKSDTPTRLHGSPDFVDKTKRVDKKPESDLRVFVITKREKEKPTVVRPLLISTGPYRPVILPFLLVRLKGNETSSDYFKFFSSGDVCTKLMGK